MPRRPLEPEKKRAIVEMLEAGKLPKVIAPAVGVSEATISRVAREFELPRRHRGPQKGTPYRPYRPYRPRTKPTAKPGPRSELTPVILDLWAEHQRVHGDRATLAGVAAEIGCSRELVRQVVTAAEKKK